MTGSPWKTKNTGPAVVVDSSSDEDDDKEDID